MRVAEASDESQESWGEENALRYVSSYICHTVQRKITKSSLPHKEEMMLFCDELCGDKGDEKQGAEDWTNAIDQGGLRHIINDYTYTVIERRHLKVSALKELNDTTKGRIIDSEALLKNDELLFQWTTEQQQMLMTVGMEVLWRIVELFVDLCL